MGYLIQVVLLKPITIIKSSINFHIISQDIKGGGDGDMPRNTQKQFDLPLISTGRILAVTKTSGNFNRCLDACVSKMVYSI